MLSFAKSFDNNGYIIKMLIYKAAIIIVKVPSKIPRLMKFQSVKMIDVDENI